MAFPSPVKTFHDDTYASIDPTSPSRSTKGKNVAISGGGSGIGPEIARSFAKSGASTISIFGRTEKSLLQTKQRLEKEYPKTKFYSYVADVVDRSTLDTAFQTIKSAVGQVDILIANAGYMPDLHPIAKSNPEDWWKAFEINVKGGFNLINAFVPVAAKNASVINMTTAVSHMPYVPAGSGYAISKLAGTRVFDYFANEYPEFFVLSMHPGVIETAMDVKTAAAGIIFPHDTIALPADFAVWAVSAEAKFLRGKLVWSNWDVDELKAMTKEIEGTNKFTLGLLGWPYSDGIPL